jgi:hypothetical protein
VERGESVFEIARQLSADDEARTVDIAHQILDENLGRVMNDGQRFADPAYIEVGWELRIPAGVGGDRSPNGKMPHGSEVDGGLVHVVRAGDTLSSIARDLLGGSDSWGLIWEANAGRTMPDGRVFEDPNLIVPGWELTVPVTIDPSGEQESDVPGNEGNSENPAVVPADAPPPIPHASPAAPTVPPTTTTPAGPAVAAEPAPEPATAAATATTPARTTRPSATRPSATPSPPASTLTARPPSGEASGPAAPPDDPTEALSSPASSPIGLEHAALLSAGVLTLVGVRRRRQLRSARLGTRVPEPEYEHVVMERQLRGTTRGTRAVRLDVALRAIAAHSLDAADELRVDETDADEARSNGTEIARVAVVELSQSGDVTVQLTSPLTLPPPWAGAGDRWELPGAVPIEELADDARRVGAPCLAVVQLGVTEDGNEVLVDLEAAGRLVICGEADVTGEIVRAIAATLATTELAEAAHIITVSLDGIEQLGNPNTHVADSVDAAVDLAMDLAGATASQQATSFELRSRRTGGDVWEPAVIVLTAKDRWTPDHLPSAFAGDGHGLALVAATEDAGDSTCVLRSDDTGWWFDGFGRKVAIRPVGIREEQLDTVAGLVHPPDVIDVHAGQEGHTDGTASTCAPRPFDEQPHDIVVRLFGEVAVTDRHGSPARFERSKSVELIAWLTTHRDRATRTAARTALWESDVRDATFANVVSEARRTLARLVAPPDGEWLARTLTEQLPLDVRVVTDADLVRSRLDHARRSADDHDALEVLGPAIQLIGGMPFAGTDYLWPDAEGITSNLVLLAVGACSELGRRALAVGNSELLFEATEQGLRVLPGHEELIGLRMRAHAQTGDLANIRQEWATYERTILADPWSDGEPSPKLQVLRAELLAGGAGPELMPS